MDDIGQSQKNGKTLKNPPPPPPPPPPNIWPILGPFRKRHLPNFCSCQTPDSAGKVRRPVSIFIASRLHDCRSPRWARTCSPPALPRKMRMSWDVATRGYTFCLCSMSLAFKWLRLRRAPGTATWLGRLSESSAESVTKSRGDTKPRWTTRHRDIKASQD